MAVVSGIREEVVTAAKKVAAVAVVAAAATAAEGIWAMVLAASKVAMASADNSGNGRAGNDGGNRGSNGATTINQNAAAVGGGSGGGGGGGSGSGSHGSYNGVAAAAMVIARLTLEKVRAAPRGTKLATYSDILDIFGACRFYFLRLK